MHRFLFISLALVCLLAGCSAPQTRDPATDESDSLDAYFEEEDGLVLVDYKTDYVEQGREQELIEKYRIQLLYYARALEQLRGKKVKEIYLYSFALGKALKI